MRSLLKAGLAFLPALFLGLAPAVPAQIGISISINTAPPVLPVYTQPPCPDQGYLWEPGYWAWGPEGYYWVPGVWVEPPQAGLVWTPGYWAFEDGDYRWNDGYWGPEVGFYGGVDYGFGYPGQGFYGGMWQGNVFRYNVAAWHVGGGIRDTYRAPVTYHPPYHTRASFNGRGGIQARPTPREMRAMHARHFQMTQAQREHMQRAAQNRQYLYKQNHGHPQHAAETRIAARAQGHPAAGRPGEMHGRPRPARPETGRPGNRPEANRPGAGHRAVNPARTEPGNRPANRNHEANPQSRTERPGAPMARPKAPVRTDRNNPQPESRSQSRPQTRPQAEHRAARPGERRAPAHAEAKGHPERHESRPAGPDKPHE